MKLFDDIKKEVAQYEAKLEEHEGKKSELEQRLADLAREYEARIEKDALGIAAFKDEKKIEDEMKDVRGEIEKVAHKMDIVKRGKRQALTNKIPFLKEIRDREREEVDREWEEGIEQIQRIKAEFLLAMSALGETSKKGQKVFAEYTALMAEADPESREAKVGMTYSSYRSIDSLPFNPNPSYFGKEKALEQGFLVAEWASKDAYFGNLPQWVTHYATTGEIKF